MRPRRQPNTQTAPEASTGQTDYCGCVNWWRAVSGGRQPQAENAPRLTPTAHSHPMADARDAFCTTDCRPPRALLQELMPTTHSVPGIDARNALCWQGVPRETRLWSSTQCMAQPRVQNARVRRQRLVRARTKYPIPGPPEPTPNPRAPEHDGNLVSTCVQRQRLTHSLARRQHLARTTPTLRRTRGRRQSLRTRARRPTPDRTCITPSPRPAFAPPSPRTSRARRPTPDPHPAAAST